MPSDCPNHSAITAKSGDLINLNDLIRGYSKPNITAFCGGVVWSIGRLTFSMAVEDLYKGGEGGKNAPPTATPRTPEKDG